MLQISILWKQIQYDALVTKVTKIASATGFINKSQNDIYRIIQKKRPEMLIRNT